MRSELLLHSHFREGTWGRQARSQWEGCRHYWTQAVGLVEPGLVLMSPGQQQSPTMASRFTFSRTFSPSHHHPHNSLLLSDRSEHDIPQLKDLSRVSLSTGQTSPSLEWTRRCLAICTPHSFQSDLLLLFTMHPDFQPQRPFGFWSIPSGSKCCFSTGIQISQEAGQVVWYSHLFQDFSTVYCDPHSQRLWRSQ